MVIDCNHEGVASHPRFRSVFRPHGKSHHFDVFECHAFGAQMQARTILRFAVSSTLPKRKAVFTLFFFNTLSCMLAALARKGSRPLSPRNCILATAVRASAFLVTTDRVTWFPTAVPTSANSDTEQGLKLTTESVSSLPLTFVSP